MLAPRPEQIRQTWSDSRRFRVAAGLLLLALAELRNGRAQTAHPYTGQAAVAGASASLPRDGMHGATYDQPFSPSTTGDARFLPSQATASFSGFLKPEAIPSAAYCARCHAQVHADWRQSAHANSFRTPWYVKNVNELGASKGVAYTRHCEGCHNPAALMTGALTTGSTVARPNDQDGVTCMVCHSIRQVKSLSGIGSYVMGQPAVLLDASGKAVPGLPTDAEILAHLDRHKAAVMQPLYKTSEYCAACHKAALPQNLNGYKWLRTFSTYDEWQQSSWSKETPLPFYEKPAVSECQSCHMQREPSSDPAAYGHSAASHRFLGANTAVAAQYNFDDQARRLVDFLKADQMEIDLFGLTVEHQAAKPGEEPNPRNLTAPLGTQGFTVLPGDWVRVDVVVRNKGIGHTLVPELRDFFESWLDFSATDDAGREIYRSGAVDKRHRVDPAARTYTLKILDHEGHGLDHHEVWKTYVKAYDATVSPGRSDVVRYRFQLPLGARGVTLSAALRYRRFRREFTDWVFNDKAEDPDRFPTVTMAQAQFHVNAGANQPLSTASPAADPAADHAPYLRWNNYGIGMLDRLQFAEAADAFEHVVRLNPGYERGYVNVAIAEYSRGRFQQSLEWLDRAEKMMPAGAPDARAAYYRGLNLRWTQHFDEAIAVLEPVGKAWPKFRQVHQELGYLYMVRRRFAESKSEYETVLRIDPDDALAHRWLGPVYDALGDHTGAAREGQLATATNNDTAAGWTAQRFWREDLTLAEKAMPGHTFSAGDAHDDADVRRVLNLQNPPSYIWIEHY